jgi:hypothetical protein
MEVVISAMRMEFATVGRRLLAAMSVIAALGAVGAAAATAQPGVPFGMRIGDEVTIDETGTIVRFNAVTEDSRCPIDALCVRAGVLRISLTVTSGVQNRRDIEIDTMGGTADAAGYTFTLVVAKPSRRADVPVEPGDYGVVIRADRVTLCCGPPPVTPPAN